MPADLGRTARVGREGLIEESSRACGRDGRRPDRMGTALLAGAGEVRPVCGSDSWHVGADLASGSDVAEREWSTERFKCKRFRKEASKFSMGHDDGVRWKRGLDWVVGDAKRRTFMGEEAWARRSAHSTQPFWRAMSSGVMPCLSGRSGTAPRSRRVRTTERWPLAAAKWSGVEPDVPTMGAAVSRLRSE